MRPIERKLSQAELIELLAAWDRLQAGPNISEDTDLPFDVEVEQIECEGGVVTNFLDDIR